MFGMIIIIFLCSYMGLLIFANYFDCDPVGAKIVSSGMKRILLMIARSNINFFLSFILQPINYCHCSWLMSYVIIPRYPVCASYRYKYYEPNSHSVLRQ